MANLEQTLQAVEALLSREQRCDGDEMDEAIWAYLASLQGIDAQAAGLDDLSKAVMRLNLSSPSMRVLMDAIDRHWQRLAGRSA
jgi:hypothetical protein